MMLVFWVEFRFEPPWWVHALIWLPLTFGGAVWLLPLLKALLIAQQCRPRWTALEEEDLMLKLRPLPWPTLISLPISIFTLGLGPWQMERREWERDSLHRI